MLLSIRIFNMNDLK
uniref:Uncharacterized protein n=1 Tax=Lepeophtheirus salmonis TaxID=72036 RepID=A0A0K2V499_LEPSM